MGLRVRPMRSQQNKNSDSKRKSGESSTDSRNTCGAGQNRKTRALTALDIYILRQDARAYQGFEGLLRSICLAALLVGMGLISSCTWHVNMTSRFGPGGIDLTGNVGMSASSSEIEQALQKLPMPLSLKEGSWSKTFEGNF